MRVRETRAEEGGMSTGNQRDLDHGALAELKIEVNVNETRSLYPLVAITIDVPNDEGGTRPLTVWSYDLDEMLGTKMRALLQRDCVAQSPWVKHNPPTKVGFEIARQWRA
jgi:hypothetical protein